MQELEHRGDCYLQQNYWMFSSVLQQNVVEIWRVSGQNDLVALERNSIHGQGDITEGPKLRTNILILYYYYLYNDLLI